MMTKNGTVSKRRVPLSTDEFNESLTRYIEDTKPDPLAKRQVQRWICDWNEVDEHEPDATAGQNVHGHGMKKHGNITITPNNYIRGTLSLKDDYVTILLHAYCEWTWDQSTESGELEFTLSVRAQFVTQAELRKRVSGDLVERDNRVLAKVLKRLKQDDYIAKLVKGDEFQPLCHAIIFMNSNQLEERVWMDEGLLESIHRAIYSQSSSVMDVVELLASFPYLSNDCPLGQRAKLRILEEAMLDACDREEEDDLIDELSLKTKDEDDKTLGQGSKKSKINKVPEPR